MPRPVSPPFPWATHQAPTAPESRMSTPDIDKKIANLQRAIYYLIWKRTGFGEHCLHCGHAYPGHEKNCKAAEIEEIIR